jgi:hypothetical protein
MDFTRSQIMILLEAAMDSEAKYLEKMRKATDSRAKKLARLNALHLGNSILILTTLLANTKLEPPYETQ